MKKVFQFLSVLALFFTVGTIGGMEWGNITLLDGIVRCGAFLGCFVACAKKGGMFYKQ